MPDLPPAGCVQGTPRQCELCHRQGSRIATSYKSADHPRTALPCNQCHTSQTSWGGAGFDHAGVMPGTCINCHNGINATGKPTTGHPTTTASCDTCHRTTAWLPAMWDHTGVTQGSCFGCHNGIDAQGMNNRHIPTSTVLSGWSCDACHSPNTVSFSIHSFRHEEPRQGLMTGNCITCHNGAYGSSGARGKPSDHMVTNASCEQCHTTVAWRPASAFNHATAVAGQCATCHGIVSTGKKAGHIPTVLSCDACHSIPPSTFATTSFAHLASQGIVAGQCETCHNGQYTSSNALGKNTRHIPTALSCDSCHTIKSSFSRPTTFRHDAAHGPETVLGAGGCNTCHIGGYQGARTKPSDHPRTTDSCDRCHTSTSNWGAGVDRVLLNRGSRKKR